MAGKATNKNTAQDSSVNQKDDQRDEVIAEGEQNLPGVDITAQNFDAEQMQEAYAEGEQKSPAVNVAADYEAAKEYSTGTGNQDASATTSQRGSSQSEKVAPVAESTGNPDDYTGMAKEINQASAAKDK